MCHLRSDHYWQRMAASQRTRCTLYSSDFLPCSLITADPKPIGDLAQVMRVEMIDHNIGISIARWIQQDVGSVTPPAYNVSSSVNREMVRGTKRVLSKQV